jgi:hypothetical protein
MGSCLRPTGLSTSAPCLAAGEDQAVRHRIQTSAAQDRADRLRDLFRRNTGLDGQADLLLGVDPGTV